jgi:hypothetical protein
VIIYRLQTSPLDGNTTVSVSPAPTAQSGRVTTTVILSGCYPHRCVVTDASRSRFSCKYTALRGFVCEGRHGGISEAVGVQLHSFLTSAIRTNGRSVLRSGRFTPWETTPVPTWIPFCDSQAA